MYMNDGSFRLIIRGPGVQVPQDPLENERVISRKAYNPFSFAYSLQEIVIRVHICKSSV